MIKGFVLVHLMGLLTLACAYPLVAQRSDQTIADKDIRVVDFEEMRYPPIARAARIQGVVVIQVILDESGAVKEARAISGSDLLVRDCLPNVKNWPNPQKSAVVVYHFEMPGGECKSNSSLFMFKGPNLAMIIGCDVPVQTAARSLKDGGQTVDFFDDTIRLARGKSHGLVWHSRPESESVMAITSFPVSFSLLCAGWCN